MNSAGGAGRSRKRRGPNDGLISWLPPEVFPTEPAEVRPRGRFEETDCGPPKVPLEELQLAVKVDANIPTDYLGNGKAVVQPEDVIGGGRKVWHRVTAKNESGIGVMLYRLQCTGDVTLLDQAAGMRVDRDIDP